MLDGYLYWAGTMAQMERSLDTAAGDTESLADAEEYARLAHALDRRDVYVASFSERLANMGVLAGNIALWEVVAGRAEFEEIDSGHSLTDESREQEEALRKGPLLSPIGKMGSAYGEDDDGPFIIVAALHESEAAAEANAPLVQERFETTATATGETWDSIVESYELTTDGALLTGTFRLSGDGDTGAFSMLPLFAFADTG